MTENTELTLKVEKALDSIRPYLRADEGDIELVEIVENIVKIKLLGACSSCSMSQMTMKAGVENTIKKEVPEILEVIAV